MQNLHPLPEFVPTLRDRFAMSALNGSAPGLEGHCEEDIMSAVTTAYRIADAMLLVRIDSE